MALFATGFLTFNGSAVGGGARANRNAGGINASCVAMGLRTGDGAERALSCACGCLSASGTLASAFKGGERERLSSFNCPRMLDLSACWSTSCRPSKCMVGRDSYRAVFGIVLAYQSLLVMMDVYIEGVAVLECVSRGALLFTI